MPTEKPLLDRTQLVIDLIRDEGLRLKPYVDTVGKVTIGVGRNLTDVGITDPEAIILLDNDIDRVVTELKKALPWWEELDEVRQRVIANMCFNLGLTKLLGFHNTLRAVAERDFVQAASGMRTSLWARQVGRRAERLAVAMLMGKTS